jgi:phosphoglycolate phosphatase
MPHRFRAAIFDLDGTLIDSLADIADATDRALSAFGFPGHDLASYRYFVGDGMGMLMRRAAPAGSGEETARRLLARMLEEYASAWRVKTRPYPGIPELLDDLVRRGCKLAVLSNKPHPMTLEVVAHFFPSVPFDRVQGSPSPSSPAKPDPALALSIAASFGLPPAEVAFVGDTRTDMRTAANAGMPAVGVSWGFRPRGELEENGAAFILDSPGQFPLYLC